jgi:hypothetical protein
MVGMKAIHGSRNVVVTGNQFSENDLWSIAMQAARSSSATNVDGGSIIANNIISDFGYGQAHWMRPGDDHGVPFRFEAGQTEGNPPLKDVIIQGNIIYDTGREQSKPPRYKYAVHIATEGIAPPKGLHFSNNIFHPGTAGISNVDIK